MKSFNPEAVAKQVPELARLLATRNLLQDLRNRFISAADFRKQIESVVNDAGRARAAARRARQGRPEDAARRRRRLGRPLTRYCGAPAPSLSLSDSRTYG